jgi:hypothetical protein
VCECVCVYVCVRAQILNILDLNSNKNNGAESENGCGESIFVDVKDNWLYCADCIVSDFYPTVISRHVERIICKCTMQLSTDRTL